jgi:hypothetical protein
MTVALAFIGQISRTSTGLGRAFYVFALVLFPTLVFLGLVTFDRVLRSSLEDIIYAHGINRIRHLYQEHAPEIQPYFVLSSHDDEIGVKANMANMAMTPGWLQTFLSTAGMISVITSVLFGALVGMLLSAPFGIPLTLAVGLGSVAFLVSLVVLQRYQWKQYNRNSAGPEVLFPSLSTP